MVLFFTMKKIIAFCDIHNEEENLRKLLPKLQAADHIFFLGDGYYPLMRILNDELKAKTIKVRGNWETHIFSLPMIRVVQVENVKFLLTHGHYFFKLHSLNRLVKQAKNVNANVCLYGHTHTFNYCEKDGIQFINVPPLGTRRTEHPNSYIELTVDGDKCTFTRGNV